MVKKKRHENEGRKEKQIQIGLADESMVRELVQHIRSLYDVCCKHMHTIKLCTIWAAPRWLFFFYCCGMTTLPMTIFCLHLISLYGTLCDSFVFLAFSLLSQLVLAACSEEKKKLTHTARTDDQSAILGPQFTVSKFSAHIILCGLRHALDFHTKPNGTTVSVIYFIS